MSDQEGDKKSGYRLEYAASNRSVCKGPKPCNGTKITKGELRLGSVVDFRGNTTMVWRHWGCTTPRIIQNMKKSFEEADELDGFEDLKDEDQDKIRKAWEEEKVADEDIPETARKPEGEEGEEEEDDKPKKKKAAGKAAKKEDADEGDKKGVFKLEYASSGRAKCKVCQENIGKDFFRIGNEVDFRGNKSFQWKHWGCIDAKTVTSLKTSYGEPSEIEGWGELKEGEQDKVRRAWEEGAVPEEDQGAGEAVDTGKKAPARRRKKAEDADDAEPKKRGRKPKKVEDEDEDAEEEKPKRKRAPAKAKNGAGEKSKAAPKKRASRKKKSSDEEDEASAEDFEDELAAVGDDFEDDELEEEEAPPKKRQRAPTSKASAKASKPPSKKASKPVSRKKKQQEEIPEESEVEED
ncbi:hypothetical protein POSPLADRAFT_1055777 [Postia placenta MAD-698-R-SB12]|uniref:PARP-type domain-containing protein n=1 Tax=Postia placenta MAD-698-R-SB12 TaxID=670580 RepID=A0A1X6N511_9APHY|nr:hypothetical protein POSPLADRAFT_1055777 [Postia placenta MAD-698-R-SB12]OSX63698.1 hypothetical protein POSPLADRAFT_1055777 [Postia placenta MAD-698-R-SB12]